MSRHRAGPLLEQRPGTTLPARPAPWLELLELTMRLCSAHGRGDLAEAIQGKRMQLLAGRVRVLVLGEPKRGKSRLVNALLNAEVCPDGDGPATPPPTLIRHAEQQTQTTLDGHRTEVGIPRAILAEGMEIVDTPGISDPSELDRVIADASADLAIFVTDGTRHLVPSEMEMLKTLARNHGSGGIILALTKIDLAPRWREVLKTNRRLVSGAGVQAYLIPVSAELRLRAAAAGDHGLNAESGFPQLVARLRQREEAMRAGAGAAARRAIEQLTEPLKAEVSTVDLQDAQRAVEELRRCTTRWQNTLFDEMADLASDLEYDLRDRTRRILAAVDEAFDTHDPLADWNAFASWLSDNLEAAAEANFHWMILRCEAIADRVADHFLRYGYRLDALPYQPLANPRAEVPLIELPGMEGFSAVQKLFTGMRGSYGGILMFGLATSLAGLPLINPLSLGAGAIFGGKTVIDEGRMLLRRRQGAAKQGAQRHIDDFFLRFSKDGRDAARYIQRAMRDHFTELTDNLQEAIVQSFRRAQRGAEAIAAERSAQLRQLTALYERARST